MALSKIVTYHPRHLQSFTIRYVVGRWQVSAAHIFWNTTLCIEDLPLLWNTTEQHESRVNSHHRKSFSW